MEILFGRGDSVLFARYTGGDSVLVNKKEWGGFCPGGILSYTLLSEMFELKKRVCSQSEKGDTFRADRTKTADTSKIYYENQVRGILGYV